MRRGGAARHLCPLAKRKRGGEKKKKSQPKPAALLQSSANLPQAGRLMACLERQIAALPQPSLARSRAEPSPRCPLPFPRASSCPVRGVCVRLENRPLAESRGRCVEGLASALKSRSVLISSCRKGFLPPPGFVHKVLSYRWGHGPIGREHIPGSSGSKIPF